ncbi:hypothetical protein Dsin_021899 [Dipteronia sinensis]|uniref:SWIM-type domain-containing protein n=1 Tax=Dipteronia sinensis TaxID=43782 RepID=A0AAE0A0K7_9ROSI|nr:hypothetical protein Dsin_021899 [Dipteronia sinensis]
MDEGEYWQIRKIDKEHSCTIEGFQGQFRQANSSVIGELVSPKLRVNGTALKPKDIMIEMPLHYGPVIAIDGTHLKGRFYGILFVAACSDGNEQVYPLAFGIGHKENRESWTWFLRRVRKCIDCPTDCMFISDQHKGIKKAMGIVYPDAPHSLCVFHLTMNLKNTFKREDVTGIFKRAYQIYRESEFNEEMSELIRVHPNAYNDLMTIGTVRWSRAYSPVRRYFMMTSNIAECINSCLRHARQFPVTVLIKYIRDMMQKWFHDRRTFTDSLHTQLTPWAIKYLTEHNEESTFYTVCPIDWNEFEVKDVAKGRLVNLLDMTCKCREFEIDLLPCAHALAALRACKRPFIDFCSHYYKKLSLVEAYAGVIQPVGHMSDWEIPDEIGSLVVHPPDWMS